jgi:hypothetical protein
MRLNFSFGFTYFAKFRMRKVINLEGKQSIKAIISISGRRIQKNNQNFFRIFILYGLRIGQK